METIYALSTAPGKAGVAVIRVSGPRAPHVATVMCGALPRPREATLREIRDHDGFRLDTGLVLFFPEKASFTGEAIVEFQVHGSRAVISEILKNLHKFKDLRSAEPGEFTRRALANGRLDLTQVEALSDLIDAETEAQRQQAMRVLSGHLGGLCAKWRGDLIRAVALLEATIDFSEEDIPDTLLPEVSVILSGVMADLERQIEGREIAERIRDGFEVAIIGVPNVGKSTLLNRLAGRDAAITSEHAGTTRDVIEVRMDIDGLPVTFLDTAGLRETEDKIETLGVGRARDRARQADLRVCLGTSLDEFAGLISAEDILLTPKADLLRDGSTGVSGLTGQGVDRLVARIGDVLAARAQGAGAAIRMRHETAMREGFAALEAARTRIAQGEEATELAAEDLHNAIRALDSLVGKVDIESVLDDIFMSFCIGK
ncbi:tRNA uridine-5-carboxymethylaminomethyl(34) synthesis GTPase MnmE [Roseovarius sp. D22-M7]|uniref:tRNA uridine-5-carboxymethylaminomethyl(34) synthesis GTPase MnmE n=1 Tax=Roseovarius sp. D22-M7 TaxID=3127116 RepID=UPI0030105987